VRFVLVHSPVVGPATWRWVADGLRRHGHVAVVPDLVESAVTGSPQRFAAAAVRAIGSGRDTVVVGHSGAGAVLPLVADRLGAALRQLVFVDAGVPPCEGTFTAGGDFLPTLRALADDGVLPPWSQWWPDGVMATLVPDDARRQEVEQELPHVPLDFYETSIEVPLGWCQRSCAYVLLSEAYRPDADRASALGWPVVERHGRHLDIVTVDEEIAAMLVELVSSS
jgi:hypothetical protein